MTIPELREWLASFFSAFSFNMMPRLKIDCRTDAEKMADDWRKVGDDMRRAMLAAAPSVEE